MPLYEYRCDFDGCVKRIELIRPYQDRDEPVICPNCISRMRRVMSVVNHTFGFRLTDACHERFGPRDEFERDI